MADSQLCFADQARDLVMRLFREQLGLDKENPALADDEPLMSPRIGFSSFSFVRAVIAIEDEAQVELADEVFKTVYRQGTIGDVIRVVCNALSTGSGAV